MCNRFFPSLVMVMLLAWLGCAVDAQDRGAVTGTVIDSAGIPMPGVAVQLVGPETRKGTTDARGVFTFDLLRAGSYQLRFERTGFVALTQPTTVQAGNTTRLTVRMSADVAVKQLPPQALREEVRADGTPPPMAAPSAAAIATAPSMGVARAIGGMADAAAIGRGHVDRLALLNQDDQQQDQAVHYENRRKQVIQHDLGSPVAVDDRERNFQF